MRLFGLLLFFVFISVLSCQKSLDKGKVTVYDEIDTLAILTQAQSMKDSMAAAFMDENWTQAIFFLKKELPFRLQIGDSVKIASCYYNLGLNFQKLENDSSYHYLLLAKKYRPNAHFILNDIGKYHYVKCDYVTAEDYFLQALVAAKKDGASKGEANALINLSNTNQEKGSFLNAARYAKEGLELDKLDDYAKQSLYLNLGNAELAQGLYLSALSNMRKATNFEADSALSSMAFISIAVVQKRLNEFESATRAIESALSFANTQNQKALCHDNMGDVQMATGNPKIALGYYQKAVSLTNDYADMFIYLGDLGMCYKLLGNDAEALKQFVKADDLVDSIGSVASGSKLFWRSKVRSIYRVAIGICHEKGDTALAWRFFEKSRAMLLLEKLSQSKKNASRLTVNIKDTQKALAKDENSVLVSFYVADSSLYAFTLANSSVNMHKLTFSQTIREAVNGLKEGCRNPNANSKEMELNGQIIYQNLIQPLQIQQFSRVIFSPDDLLTGMSFDAIHDGKGYLVFKHAISYIYSASTALANRQNKPTNYPRTTVFAPIYFKENFGLPNLFRTKGENLSYPKVFELELYEGEKAKKETFCHMPKQADILAFNTHAIANDSVCQMYFADSTMLMSELESFNLGAKLAVLAACETALGKYQQGEGTMSLARGFASAGVPSTVANGWAVNEEATMYLLTLFYEKLAEGLPIDIAMQKAKISFLESSPVKVPNMTNLWAAPMLFGDSSPIVSKSWNWKWYLLPILGGLLIAGTWVRRRR